MRMHIGVILEYSDYVSLASTILTKCWTNRFWALFINSAPQNHKNKVKFENLMHLALHF